MSQPTPGNKIGPYVVTREIGRGGMGVVYLAHDTKLDRDVAIKALPVALAQDVGRLARFEREARALAQLNHPNVAGIHGVEEQEGQKYLILEYVEGETLAERLDHGAIPFDEARAIAVQIAAGVEAAHEAGIIHRDLKPDNIKLTPSGQVKVLDFGLARNDSGTGSGASSDRSVTVTPPTTPAPTPTEPGAILGTAPYMSPEQARGRRLDKRSDIWSFGVVFYECLTGLSPFVGETVSDSLGAILHKDVDLDLLPPGTPARVRHVLRGCLQRDKNERWRDIGDVRLELQASSKGADASAHAARPTTSYLPWSLTGVAVLIAAVALGLWLTGEGAPVERSVHAQLMPPDGAVYEYRSGPPAVSPDGRMVVFVARGEDDDNHLWLRELDKPTARRLEGTADGEFPFWSPDSQAIGFFDGAQLRRLDLDGRPPDVVCEALGAHGGGAWNEAGVIVFATGRGGALAAVPASGGQPTPVTEIDRTTNEFSHRAPCFLPDGRRFLFSTRRGIGGENGVAVGSLEGEAHRRVLDVDSNTVFVEPGYVLYWRGGAVRAQRFDPETASVLGEPFVVAPGTRFEPVSLTAHFSASAGGVLVYHPGESATVKSRLVLRDRKGETVGQVGEDGNYYSPRFSRDGRFVAVDSSGVQNNGDIWIYGVSSPTSIRLTFDIADESSPVWSPDDKRIAFLTGRDGPDDVHLKEVSNPANAEVLCASSDYTLTPTDWSPDGQWVAVNRSLNDNGEGGDILLVSPEGADEILFLASQFTTQDLKFSRDGLWCLYSSNETGQFEVYLRLLDDPSSRRQISVGGGFAPLWRGDGEEVYYRSLDDRMMAVAIEGGPDGGASAPVALFEVEGRFEDGTMDCDVTPDGQTWVVNTALAEDEARPMSLVIHWTADLAK